MNENSQELNSVQLVPGDRVGAYRIERSIGSGGMAEVFYAVHEDLQRPAAIKVLRASLATDETHLQRFMQEARAAARLVHPNIVQVYDVGRDGDQQYIAQEYIPGSNLRQYLTSPDPELNAGSEEATAEHAEENGKPAKRDRQLPLSETLSILLQVLAALTKSANSGIVHRDIKPENIMLTTEGEVKVADFGLARVLLSDDPQLTRAGTTLGTPMYMSPEQIQEGQVDIRSDLYSLGATIYHMLAGAPPYEGETPLALAMKHVQADVPDISRLRSDLPPSMRELLSRLLAKSPDDRFSHPSEVISFLKSRRSSDLAEAWPDQTVPLPGASARLAAGPMQATMILQSKLREARLQRRRQWLNIVQIAGVLVVAFLAGFLMTWRTPVDLSDQTSTALFNEIPQQATVEEQYQLALFRRDMDRIDKWLAVEHYFPKDEGAASREYAGMASLQLGAAFQDQEDFARAERVLKETTQDPKMMDQLVALAYLQLAAGAQRNAELEDEEASRLMDEYVDSSKDVAKDLRKGEKDLLRERIEYLPRAIQARWFPADP